MNDTRYDQSFDKEMNESVEDTGRSTLAQIFDFIHINLFDAAQVLLDKCPELGRFSLVDGQGFFHYSYDDSRVYMWDEVFPPIGPPQLTQEVWEDLRQMWLRTDSVADKTSYNQPPTCDIYPTNRN